MNYQYRQLIGGEWCEATNGRRWDVLNPANEEVVRTIPFGSQENCRRALEAWARAFAGRSGRTAYECASLLRKAAGLIRDRIDSLARTTVLESGSRWFRREANRASRPISLSGTEKNASGLTDDGFRPGAAPNDSLSSSSRSASWD